MANDNDTVEQIHDELKRDPLAPNGAKPWTHYLAERILAAHKREIAEQSAVNEAQAAQLRDALNECENLKWKVENYSSVVAAKDAEIAKLKACRDGECERIRLGAEPCAGCHVQVANDEVASLRALLKELNECLREAVIEVCHDHACCGMEYECNGVDGDCFVKSWRAALAKAAGE